MTTILLASFPSPSQGVWHLGPVPIRAYALFILVGVIAALFIGNKRWAARGGEPGVIYDIALWAIIFGLIGGRLYHVLTDWSTYFGPGGAGLAAAFKIQEGGLGIWGAVALGGVGAWIGCRRKGIPLPAFGDAVAPGIVLAQAIGRIGNYFNQELYGRTTSLPWGLERFERRDVNGALDSLNGVSTGQLIEIVHPTFLYELLWNLLVFVFLIWVDRRYRIGHGRLFALYVAAYCFGRFWIELMRSDMATHIAGIRINSFVSVFVFIGAVVYIMVAPKGREDPSELLGDADIDEEESPVEEVAKELVAVAATTGVVAAAKVAGEKEDEDSAAEVAAQEKPDSEDGEESEAEAVAEGEQLVEDVADAPAEDIAEAEAFAEAGEEAEAADDAEADSVGGLGSVEGDDAVEAEDAAAEVHEAAVESAEEAAEVADETADEDSDESEESESSTESGDDEAQPASDDAEAEEDEEKSKESGSDDVGGLGAVEGDDAVEAEDAAAEVHAAAVESAEVADEAADEDSDESEESESSTESGDDEAQPASDEAEAEEDEEKSKESGSDDVGGLGAVEGDDAVEAEDAAAEVHEAAVVSAEDAADIADETADEDSDESEESESSTESGDDEAQPASDDAEAEEDEEKSKESGADEGAEKGSDEIGGTRVRGFRRPRFWRGRGRR